MPSPQDTANTDRRVATPLAGIFEMFREGACLVDAAFDALERVSGALSAIESSLRDGIDPAALATALAAIRRHIEDAGMAGDNLLVADVRTRDAGPLLVRALARDAAGTLTIRDIPIERAPLAMIGDGAAAHAFDRLEAACRAVPGKPIAVGAIVPALEAMTTHVATAASRLSVVKARLELQSSFVAAVAGADVAPIVQSPVDITDARALALRTRRLLGGQSLDIGNSNRRMLQALFARP